MPSFLYGWSELTVIQSTVIASVAFVFAGAVNTFVSLPHFLPPAKKGPKLNDS